MVHGFFVILRAKYKNQANKYDMNLLDIILLAVALAMDCFTVSIVSGVIDHGDWHNDSSEAKIRGPVPVIYLRMAFLFGFFQALMPLLGWLGISHFQTYMEAYDHWIAFGLLGFIGGKMIWESFGDEEDQHFNPRKLRTQLLLAVATSNCAPNYSWPLPRASMLWRLVSLLPVRVLPSFRNLPCPC